MITHCLVVFLKVKNLSWGRVLQCVTTLPVYLLLTDLAVLNFVVSTFHGHGLLIVYWPRDPVLGDLGGCLFTSIFWKILVDCNVYF